MKTLQSYCTMVMPRLECCVPAYACVCIRVCYAWACAHRIPHAVCRPRSPLQYSARPSAAPGNNHADIHRYFEHHVQKHILKLNFRATKRLLDIISKSKNDHTAVSNCHYCHCL